MNKHMPHTKKQHRRSEQISRQTCIEAIASTIEKPSERISERNNKIEKQKKHNRFNGHC